MKTFLTLAIVAATFASASLASAHENVGGHFEWRDAPTFGPRAIPHRIRLWVPDEQATAANDCCAMPKAGASGCTMDMSGQGRTGSAS